MKKITKLTSYVLTSLMALSCILATPSVSAKTYSGTKGNITWSVNESTGKLTVSRKSGVKDSVTMANYNAPNKNYAPWYTYKDKIKEISVGANISKIGDYAFYGLSKATSATIGKSVEDIGAACFANTALKKFSVSEGNKSFKTKSSVLYKYTDGKPTTLIAYPVAKAGTEFVIPATVKTIKGYAFFGNKNLTRVSQEDNKVSVINTRAFSKCEALTNVVIKNNCTTLGDRVFFDSPKLSKVTIPPSVTSIGSDTFSSDADTYKKLNVHCSTGSLAYKTFKEKGKYTVTKQEWTFKVSFDAQGGKLDGDSSKTVTYDKTYGTLPKAEKEGYKFTKWTYDNKTITSSTNMLTPAPHTLKAVYEAKQYTVNLDPAGGICNVSKIKPYYGKAYGSLPGVNDIKKDGSQFIGWYTVPQENNEEADEKYRVYENTVYKDTSIDTLYAHWQKETYIISLESSGGDYYGEAYKTLRLGDKFGQLPIPTRKYYEFLGWYTVEQEDEEADYSEYKVEKDTEFANAEITTLYAHWQKIKKVENFKITYKSKTSVKLSWAKQDGADGYYVYIKTDSGLYKKSLATTKTSATISNLSTKKVYRFKVRAYKVSPEAGESTGEFSNVLKRTTTYVAKPKLKTKFNRSTLIYTLSWSPKSNVTYTAQIKGSNGKWKTIKVSSNSKVKLRFISTGKTYKFRVRGYKTVLGHKVYGRYKTVTKKL